MLHDAQCTMHAACCMQNTTSSCIGVMIKRFAVSSQGEELRGPTADEGELYMAGGLLELGELEAEIKGARLCGRQGRLLRASLNDFARIQF